MIDPDTIDQDYPSLALALGGAETARAALADLVALLRRAGVELPGFPPDIGTTAQDDDSALDGHTEISRGEFFQVLTGNVPERLTE